MSTNALWTYSLFHKAEIQYTNVLDLGKVSWNGCYVNIILNRFKSIFFCHAVNQLKNGSRQHFLFCHELVQITYFFMPWCDMMWTDVTWNDVNFFLSVLTDVNRRELTWTDENRWTDNKFNLNRFNSTFFLSCSVCPLKRLFVLRTSFVTSTLNYLCIYVYV